MQYKIFLGKRCFNPCFLLKKGQYSLCIVWSISKCKIPIKPLSELSKYKSSMMDGFQIPSWHLKTKQIQCSLKHIIKNIHNHRNMWEEPCSVDLQDESGVLGNHRNDARASFYLSYSLIVLISIWAQSWLQTCIGHQYRKKCQIYFYINVIYALFILYYHLLALL